MNSRPQIRLVQSAEMKNKTSNRLMQSAEMNSKPQIRLMQSAEMKNKTSNRLMLSE